MFFLILWLVFFLVFFGHSGAEMQKYLQAICDAARCAPPETADDHLLFFFGFTVGQNWMGTSATPRDAPPEVVVSKTLRYY